MVPLMAFLTGMLVVAGVYSVMSDLYFRDRARVSQRLDESFRQRDQDRVRRSALFKDLGRMAQEAAAEIGRPTLRQRLDELLEQSGLEWPMERFLGITAIVAAVGAAIPGLWFFHWVPAVAGALMAALIPLLYVSRRARARRQKLLAQLPEAFDLMSRVIRTGQTIPHALRGVADEFDPPISREFSYCFEQQNLGLDLEVTLRDLARRTGLLEIRIFVMGLVIQQQTGGNLAELLDKLASVVRERFRVRGKIQTLTAEGRFQALILVGLIPCLTLIVTLLNRQFGRVLLEHWGLLLTVAVSEVFGLLWIRRIVNFDF